ncbi:MAG: hypothetical protein LC114_27445 [Bryobacterales bacterium]|nr:hypothetical protein [Bryobacterales bacterium]
MEPTVFNRRRLILLAASTGLLVSCREHEFRIGEAWFRGVYHGGSSRRFIHIHGNETTARLALAQHMETWRGRAFFVSGEARNIRVGGLMIDPNRMFSRVGAQASFKLQNPGASEEAVSAALVALERDVPRLLGALLPRDGGLLISVHNNSEGYNIQTEIPISEAHHLPSPSTPNDFFLATDARDFELLRNSAYNAVLQTRPATEDDGSLSRLCAARGIRYVNVECYAGRLEQQQKMLAWLDGTLPLDLPEAAGASR